MNIKESLLSRSESKCELCTQTTDLQVYKVSPSDGSLEKSILVCGTCATQINNPETVEPNHWRCLNESMWSEVPAVQVMAWRMLNRLQSEDWTLDLLNMMYLDDQTLNWAKAEEESTPEEEIKHIDSNGNILQAGDTVVLIKDLNVKGVTFTAKRGTAVRNISLVYDNAEQIEGRINGQHIVILTKFVKK